MHILCVINKCSFYTSLDQVDFNMTTTTMTMMSHDDNGYDDDDVMMTTTIMINVQRRLQRGRLRLVQRPSSSRAPNVQPTPMKKTWGATFDPSIPRSSSHHRCRAAWVLRKVERDGIVEGRRVGMREGARDD